MKTHTTITLDIDLLAEARGLSLNISKIANDALKEALHSNPEQIVNGIEVQQKLEDKAKQDRQAKATELNIFTEWVQCKERNKTLANKVYEDSLPRFNPRRKYNISTESEWALYCVNQFKAFNTKKVSPGPPSKKKARA